MCPIRLFLSLSLIQSVSLMSVPCNETKTGELNDTSEVNIETVSKFNLFLRVILRPRADSYYSGADKCLGLALHWPAIY